MSNQPDKEKSNDRFMTQEEAHATGVLRPIEEVITDPKLIKFYQENAEYFEEKGYLEDYS